MTSVDAKRSGVAEGAFLAVVRAGDEAAFSALVERYRRELQVHCYRMLGSYEDSEDLVQETFLRAWHRRTTFEGRSSFRAWLYRIATNACLDSLQRSSRRTPKPKGPGTAPASEVTWLQPYPDHLLEGIAPSEDEPDVAVVARETIELAFLVAIQHLPPRQRAVLILRDVLGWSANDSAALLDVSVAAANSALQRARATLRQHLPERRMDWAATSEPNEQERALLRRYMDATDRGDAGAIAALLREDARFSMPPEPGSWVGPDTIVAAWVSGGFGSASYSDLRCTLTRANLQPAVACYLRRPGEPQYSALGVDVLRIEGGLIAEIVTFCGHLFPVLGLPPTLSPGVRTADGEPPELRVEGGDQPRPHEAGESPDDERGAAGGAGRDQPRAQVTDLRSRDADDVLQ
jgi:RNA polymerase sigma-70 factor (ECF subfamily)